MKLINDKRPRLPIEDYSIALRKAIAWLGERYVPAVPVKPRMTDPSDHAFFCESRPWITRSRTGTKNAPATCERRLP
jgi:hypothetical protein